MRSEIYPFYEYKNSPNSYNETAYTEPHREAMTALALSIWNVSLSDIAEDRGLSVESVKSALESGPKTAQEAIDLKIMDKLGWPEEAEDAARERAGEDTEFVELAAYIAPTISLKAPLIAVIGGEGPIVTGGSESGSPFSRIRSHVQFLMRATTKRSKLLCSVSTAQVDRRQRPTKSGAPSSAFKKKANRS